MPATSMIQIGALVDPRMLVEVEAIAYKPGVGSSPADAASISADAARPADAASPAHGAAREVDLL